MTLHLTPAETQAMEMTGTNMMKLLTYAEQAVDAAGKGEMRSVLLIKKLHQLGVDLVLMNRPTEVLTLTSQDVGTSQPPELL